MWQNCDEEMVNCQHERAYNPTQRAPTYTHRPKRFSIDLDLKSYFASCKIVMLNRSIAETSIKHRSVCVRACMCANVVYVCLRTSLLHSRLN